MRSLLLMLSPFAYLLQVQQIQVKAIETTPTQAVLVFHVPDPSNCTIKVTLDAAGLQPVHDSNTTLFAGSQNCGRPGSLVDGNTVTFVSGLRRAQKGADQRFHSRALEADRDFWFQIQSGAESKSGQFRTQNPPIGKAFGEPYPYEADAPGHYAWPTIDWTDRAKEYVDPLTGLRLKRMTAPGMSEPNVTAALPGAAAYGATPDWTSASSGAVIDGAAATYAGSSRTPLFIRGPVVCPGTYDCPRAARWNTAFMGVDDIQVSLKAWCGTAGCLSNAGGERNVEICLTVDGVGCATDWKTITAGTLSSSAAAVFPSAFPAPLFQSWLGNGFITPPARPDLATYTGTVNTNGADVTWTSGHTFNVYMWKAGSIIVVNNVEYVIAAVGGATKLTLETSAGVQTNVPFTGSNFGALVRKKTTSADSLSIDGASFRWAESEEFELGATGAQNFCNPNTVTDSGGKKGFICSFASANARAGLWFISPTDGEARILAFPKVPFVFDTSGGAIDANHTGCRFMQHLVNPNQFFCMVESAAVPNQGFLLFRGTYHPEGRAGCSQPGGYQEVPAGNSCLISWEYLTKPSQNRAISQLAQAFDSRFTSGQFPFANIFSVQGNYVGFFAWSGQDTMAWSIWLNATTGDIASMQDYYSKLPCRFCAVHSFLPLGDDTYNAVAVKDMVGGTTSGAGKYQLPVTTVSGSTTGALSTSTFQTCPADLPQQFKNAGAIGDKCITVTLPGDPCDLTPSPWEQANLPACSWQAGATTLQPIIEGDEAVDGFERFLFVRKLSNTDWILLRHYNIPHGPTLKEGTSTLSNHATGWNLTMACAAATSSGYVWVNFANDPHGAALLRDNALSRSEHGDLARLGTVIVGFDGSKNLNGRFIWNAGLPERIGVPADILFYTGRTFGGIDVNSAPAFRDFLQTHPTWRQSQAVGSEQRWYLDGNPFAAQAGGAYTLWNQTAALVSGSLYKLGALPSPLVRKYLPTVAWSGRTLLSDVSAQGAVITGNAADNWKYCVADFTGECVAGSNAGDVYLNVPSMTLDGLCGNTFLFHRPCFTSMVNLGIGINQYGVKRHTAFGQNDRHLTSQLQRYNATWTYNHANALPDASWAITAGSWLDGARSDLLMFKIPPFPDRDSVNRQNYIPVPVQISAREGSPRARVRFGYAENGSVDSYYCTSRKEACTASGTPFTWLSESSTGVLCTNGCKVNIAGISGRIVYYVVDRLTAGGAVIDSDQRGAIAIR